MIPRLLQNISSGLKKVKQCRKVYVEDVPQNFLRPSFMVTFYDQNPRHGINRKLKNTVRIDALYFPESKEDTITECLGVGQDLVREFLVENFKIKNRNLKITDNVLHFMFDVDYQEFLDVEEVKMQTSAQNTDLKEV